MDEQEDLSANIGQKVVKSTNDVTLLAKEISDFQKAYAEQRVYGNKDRKTAMKLAGSTAKDKYLSKMAYEIETKPEVIAYMDALRDIRSEDAAIALNEIISYTRDCIQMAMANNKPKDAEGHIRLLAEIGGHTKSGSAPTNNTTINNTVQTANNLRSENPSDDYKRFKDIIN